MKKMMFILLCFTYSNGYAQEKFLKLENLFIKLMTEHDFNGNVLIAEAGEPIFKKSYGLENKTTDTKLSVESIFCLASITKQFTAAGIILLKKEGKLNFEDRLVQHIPELAFYGDISIHQLLRHTSGVPDYMVFMDELWDKKEIATNRDVIKVMKEQEPAMHFPAGKQWEYSNTGYMLLASIIERVSGLSFDAFLKTTIFSPSEMDNTFIYSRRLAPRKIEKLTVGYSYSDSLDQWISPDDLGKEFFITYLDGLYGGGRLFSTTEDLLKWDRVLHTEHLFTAEDKALMFSVLEEDEEPADHYAYGWMLEKNADFGDIAYHSGRWGGYITYIERHLDSDKTVIVLQNLETENTIVPVDRIRNILYGLEKALPLDVLDSYKGKYLTKSGRVKEVFLLKERLYVPMNASVKLELIPVSETKFIVDGFSPIVSYEFSKDDLGNVLGYRIRQEGTDLDEFVKRVE